MKASPPMEPVLIDRILVWDMDISSLVYQQIVGYKGYVSISQITENFLAFLEMSHPENKMDSPP
jgi:hypothetical protein